MASLRRNVANISEGTHPAKTGGEGESVVSDLQDSVIVTLQ